MTRLGNPLPEEFSPIHNGAKIKTFYTNTAVQNSARTIDYFPQLKALASIKTAQGQIEFRTSLAGGPSSRISQISVIEVDKKINQNLGAGDLREDKISIDLSDCHWLRLWFAKADATWQKYNVDFEPANSIDFFLNEGFVMLPDRENAAMLPTSSKISQIHLKSHGNELVELLIGSKSMLHPITFKTPMLNSADFKIFLIRAPKCDAVFRMTPKFTRGNLKIFNNFQLSGAKIYAIQKN
ncbi:unnamed protein product [Caenorhabditis angaria]|uniref:Uncharacterized protein n=1 Tax=Caenorhabditis angaria TaxID=860376 RepID=A0A9P1IEB9_9PELO|nr:unnamed protein product [Caenorhabditis angaria]